MFLSLLRAKTARIPRFVALTICCLSRRPLSNVTPRIFTLFLGIIRSSLIGNILPAIFESKFRLRLYVPLTHFYRFPIDLQITPWKLTWRAISTPLLLQHIFPELFQYYLYLYNFFVILFLNLSSNLADSYYSLLLKTPKYSFL